MGKHAPFYNIYSYLHDIVSLLYLQAYKIEHKRCRHNQQPSGETRSRGFALENGNRLIRGRNDRGCRAGRCCRRTRFRRTQGFGITIFGSCLGTIFLGRRCARRIFGGRAILGVIGVNGPTWLSDDINRRSALFLTFTRFRHGSRANGDEIEPIRRERQTLLHERDSNSTWTRRAGNGGCAGDGGGRTCGTFSCAGRIWPVGVCRRTC